MDQAASLINDSRRIMVIQAENPDGDSLGSSLALEEILSDLGKEVVLYAPIEIPKYLRYFSGWDRVTDELETKVDLVIVVDTAADVLLGKVLESPGARHLLETHPVLVIDHHTTAPTLSFEHTLLTQDVVATSEVIYHLAEHAQWSMNAQAAENILGAMLSDTLGLSTQNVTAATLRAAAALIDLGAAPSVIESRRRSLMKKSPEILAYKGELISRIEYLLEGRLAVIHIPWDDIQRYSDQYNPSVLVLDEMMFVEGVSVAVALKTYPDGKVTGKVRANLPISEQIAGYFGGGGHSYAAGFRVYDAYDQVISELVSATEKSLKELQHDSTAS